ncbi:MAG: ROK family protein [Caldilineaceae bacterium]|nr:ROK family protein [Caldilineaceae bacterium]
MEILGIDIGGSGIKGAPVDIETGELTADRYRIPTPQPSKPAAVAEVVHTIVKHFDWSGPFGCAFPAVVQHGVTRSAANVDDEWIDFNAVDLFARTTGLPVCMINDADAAGIAAMAHGSGQDLSGVVLMLTVGTGIGSALFIDGILVPNTELGHLKLNNMDAETDAEDYASDRARKAEDLSWKVWGKRLNEYLQHVEFIFSPDLIIIGGGVSKKHAKYFKYLDLKTKIVPAELRNEAGIIGAAMAARDLAVPA